MKVPKISTELARKLADIELIAFDFDGVFTDNSVYVDSNGVESVRCSRADGIGIAELRRAGIDSVVVSSEKNPVVKMRCQKLKIPCIYGVSDKVAALKEYLETFKLPPSKIAFVGNDLNDLEVLRYAGIAVCVNDSHPSVLGDADLVLNTAGGQGAVREICDLVLELVQNRIGGDPFLSKADDLSLELNRKTL